MRKYTRTTRKKRGGNSGPIPGTSAGTYVYNNYDSQPAQFSRVNNNNSDLIATKSNFLTPSWDLTLGSKGLIPDLGKYMSGGKSKKKIHKKKGITKKKGGFFYEVIKQAVVPFTLLAMSDVYSNKTMYKKKSMYKKSKKPRK
jgi:hypothetical protein